MLAIGRCLMGAPDLVMFDEPSLGLAPAIVQGVLSTMRDLNRDGLTCVLVEQNVAVSLKLASRAYVLENGRVTLSGSGAELLADDRVRRPISGYSETSNQPPQAIHDGAERGCARAERRKRKGLPQPVEDFRRRRRFHVGKRFRHRAGHIGLGPPAYGRGDHRDVAKRNRRLDAEGDAAGGHGSSPTICGALPTRDGASSSILMVAGYAIGVFH